MSFEKRDWRELCEAASKEQDPDKLRAIISELIKVLDERKAPTTSSRKPCPKNFGLNFGRLKSKRKSYAAYGECESSIQDYPYSFSGRRQPIVP